MRSALRVAACMGLKMKREEGIVGEVALRLTALLAKGRGMPPPPPRLGLASLAALGTDTEPGGLEDEVASAPPPAAPSPPPRVELGEGGGGSVAPFRSCAATVPLPASMASALRPVITPAARRTAAAGVRQTRYWQASPV